MTMESNGSGGMFELPRPGLEVAVRLAVDVGPVVDVGTTGQGGRRLVPILGGRVEGPAFSGTILPGGSDVQRIRTDGVTEIAARYVIATPGGSHVYVENCGVRHAPAEVLERMGAGEDVDPSLIYFRSVPRFETDDEQLQWLERDQFVATGHRRAALVRIDVFRVT
jgi:hypothetical protein